MPNSETAAPETQAAPTAPAKEKDTKNGVTRPFSLEGKTGRVWAMCDTLTVTNDEGQEVPVRRAAVMDALAGGDIPTATIATQYARWRIYKGLGPTEEEREARRQRKEARETPEAEGSGEELPTEAEAEEEDAYAE